jgi:hypothetical protein
VKTVNHLLLDVAASAGLQSRLLAVICLYDKWIRLIDKGL